jgi:hypothetical protein
VRLKNVVLAEEIEEESVDSVCQLFLDQRQLVRANAV